MSKTHDKRVKLKLSLEPLIMEAYFKVYDTQAPTDYSINDLLEKILRGIISGLTQYEVSPNFSNETNSNTINAELYSNALKMVPQLNSYHKKHNNTNNLLLIIDSIEKDLFSDHKFIFSAFKSMITGWRQQPFDSPLHLEDTATIETLVSIAIRVTNVSAVTHYGRKIGSIAHSLTYSEKLINFLSASIPIGIPCVRAVRNLGNNEICQTYKKYDYKKMATASPTILGFSFDNLQYAKYVNSDVSSRKFSVPLITTSLIWSIKLNDSFDSRRGSLKSVNIDEIRSILEINEKELDKYINIHESKFPLRSNYTYKPEKKKSYLFASAIPWKENRTNIYYADTICQNPATVEGLIQIIEENCKSVKKIEKAIEDEKDNQSYSKQAFLICIADGSPGKQIIKAGFGVKGLAYLRASLKLQRELDESVVLVPGIMHVGMIINQIVLQYMEDLFPWMFSIMGIGNVFFKQSILKSTNFRKSYSVSLSFTEAVLKLIITSYELQTGRKCCKSSTALNWAIKCNDATFRLLGFLCKYTFSPLQLINRRNVTPESILFALKLILHFTFSLHPNYLELLSLFLLQYTRAPNEIKESIKASFILKYNNSFVYNDEMHELYNKEVQDLVRSHKFVNIEDYAKSVYKLPFIIELQRKYGVIPRSSHHTTPSDTWEDENIDIFSTLFYYYSYTNDGDHFMVMEKFCIKIYDTKEKSMNQYTESLSSKHMVAYYLLNGSLKIKPKKESQEKAAQISSNSSPEDSSKS